MSQRIIKISERIPQIIFKISGIRFHNDLFRPILPSTFFP